MRELAPEVIVVAAFGQIIPQRVLDIPPLGCINVHGSLLPRWRGAAPMQYALMAGDAETGVTTMMMDAGLDTGDILLQAALPLDDIENLGVLEPRLAELGADLLMQTLDALARGDCPRIPQDAGRRHPRPLPAAGHRAAGLEPARPRSAQPGARGDSQAGRLHVLAGQAPESLAHRSRARRARGTAGND